MSNRERNRPAAETFRRTVLHHRMIAPGDLVLAACSGGPDSIALFNLLLDLRTELPFDLVLAHFDHGLRPEAEEDQAFVRKAAGDRGIRFMTEKCDVAAFAAENRLGLEEAGRRLRYEFLHRAAAEVGAGVIATGHTMNDQAETVMMRVMRGTGLTGLAGIPPVADYEGRRIIRPLIDVNREGIDAFLKERGLSFRTDGSNFDRRFLRNRVRHDLLPELEKKYGCRPVDNLARLAGLVREEEQVLGELIRSVGAMLIGGVGREAALDAGLLGLMPRPVARRIVREFLREVKGDLAGFSLDDVERIVDLEEDREATIAGGFLFRRERGRIFLKKKRVKAVPFEMSWDGREELYIETADMTFRATELPNPGTELFEFNDAVRAFLDREALTLPFAIRNRLPGDKYRPYGSPGRKKVKEMLRARGIPVGARAGLPVFMSGGEIVWIPGLPAAEKFRIKDGTRTVLLIEAVDVDPIRAC